VSEPDPFGDALDLDKQLIKIIIQYYYSLSLHTYISIYLYIYIFLIFKLRLSTETYKENQGKLPPHGKNKRNTRAKK
jgi:hypothetical protein